MMQLNHLLIKSGLYTATVFLAHALSGFLEEMVVAGNELAWIYLFLWYWAFLFVVAILAIKLMRQE